MENLVPIGRFAEAARLSQKALRHYDATGLLAPAWVDPLRATRGTARTSCGARA